jgi:DNA polymerase III delta prime subunit
VRFNQLPKKDIFCFIKNMVESENIKISDTIIDTIQNIYHSDIRSMINFIQLNQNLIEWEKNIINNTTWESLHSYLCSAKKEHTIEYIIEYIHNISIKYNMDKKNIIQTYFNYIIQNYPARISSEYLNLIETLLHNNEAKIEYIIKYFIIFVKDYYLQNPI